MKIISALLLSLLGSAAAMDIGGGMTTGPDSSFSINFEFTNVPTNMADIASITMDGSTATLGPIVWDSAGSFTGPAGSSVTVSGVDTQMLTWTFADTPDGFNPGEMFSVVSVDPDFLDGPLSVAIGEMVGVKVTFTFDDGYVFVGVFVDDPAPDAGLKLVPMGGGVKGDPHFKTWAAKWYDFHGICDLVLVSAPDFANGLGLDIHIRTKPRYEYSYIETAAIKIGDDILEVGSFGEYYVNSVRDTEMPFSMAGKFPVHYHIVDEKKHVFKIQTGENEAIVINTHKDLVNINVENATYANFATSTGMMGKFYDGALVARDGVTIVEDHNRFGQEWMVTEADGEFFQAPSVYKECVPPGTIRQSRRLGETTVSEEAAKIACAHYQDEQMRDMCVFDVIAMADLEMAEVHGAF